MLNMLLQDKAQSDKNINKVKKLIDTHERFTSELKIEYEECQGIVNHGLPSVVDDIGVIKDKDQWISDCKSLLSATLSIARADTLDMNEIGEQVENFDTAEVAVKDIIFNACTYKDEGYLRHIQICGQRLDGKN